MSIKETINEIVRAKLSENTVKPLHAELKELDKNAYYQGGGGSSVSTTLFRGPKNTYFDKIQKMATDRGYRKAITERNLTEYHKDLDGGKRTAKIGIRHDGKHVYGVDTITYRNHY